MGFSKVCTLAGLGLVISALVFAGSKKEVYPAEVNISFVESPFNLQIMVMKEQEQR